MKKWMLAATAALAAVALPGCVVESYGHGYETEVAVPVHHVHDAWCGHYYDGGRWYHRHHHVHGHGCGHVLIEGRWIIR